MRIGSRTLFPIAATAFVIAVVPATAVQMIGESGAPRSRDAGPQPAALSDPLRTELARCAALGEAALQDAACQQAWAEHRRRFLAPRLPANDRDSSKAPNGSDDETRDSPLSSPPLRGPR